MNKKPQFQKPRRQKKPRFFCDNCGIEVSRDTKACPQCGRFFAQVRCPACGFTAEESAFMRGCPSCGYSSPPSNGASSAAPIAALPHNKKLPAKPLPAWVYIFSVCAFISVCAVLFFILRR